MRRKGEVEFIVVTVHISLFFIDYLCNFTLKTTGSYHTTSWPPGTLFVKIIGSISSQFLCHILMATFSILETQ
jgi:hypothetical protein